MSFPVAIRPYALLLRATLTVRHITRPDHPRRIGLRFQRLVAASEAKGITVLAGQGRDFHMLDGHLDQSISPCLDTIPPSESIDPFISVKQTVSLCVQSVK